MTPLIWAAFGGHYNIVEILIDIRADVNAEDRDIKSQHFSLDQTKVKTTKGLGRLLATIAIILLASFVGIKCLENQMDIPALSNKKS